MSIEAMKLALALNAWTNFGECRVTDGPIPTPAEVDAALRQAIEQAEQAQPAAHCRVRPLQGNESIPQVRVEWIGNPVAGPLYTAPPRQPLTEEQIRDLWSWSMTAEAERTANTQQHAFARAIEAAHGIKGGA